MKEKLEGYIKEALEELGITDVAFTMEHPADMTHGDWATNLAMMAAKKADKNPRVLAEEIVAKLQAKRVPDIAAIDVAGPGFINFKIAPTVFDKELSRVISKEEKGEKWGWNDTLKGKKVMVEYTDPNPFKEFHIGHLMSNAIGESISRLVEASGAEVKRACYQGDVGLHVAKAILSMKDHPEAFLSNKPAESAALLGSAYAAGSDAYESSEVWKKEAVEVNKKIYNRSDTVVNELYDKYRKVSLDGFQEIYSRLGTKFDNFFFESETGETGKKVVAENKIKVFEESEGAT
ncbi:MAG TPA: arginine--tRNA ligase, partial [Candidatus Paceibacterota bacterium]